MNQSAGAVLDSALVREQKGRCSGETPEEPSFEVLWAQLFLKQSGCSWQAGFVGSVLL